MLLLDHFIIDFREIWIKIQILPYTKMHLTLSSEKWRPFFLGLHMYAVRFSRKYEKSDQWANNAKLIQSLAQVWCFRVSGYLLWVIWKKNDRILKEIGRSGNVVPNWISLHDDVIKWKHFTHYRPFVRGIHRSRVNSLHKGQWRGALTFSLICVWITGWETSMVIGDAIAPIMTSL